MLAALASKAAVPIPPVILEPALELQAVHGADVHMVTEKFSDPDGDGHRCTDWQIREGEDVVWTAPCVAGPLLVHIHLGDGLFVGNHAGASELRGDTRFELRVRHRDDSEDPEAEWSDWSTRRFQTVLPSPIEAMRLDEILPSRTPQWKLDDGEEIALPAEASLSLETVDQDVLVRIDAGTTQVAEARATPAFVRLRVTAGSDDWSIPQSRLTLEDGHGERRSVYLPSLLLAPHEEALFWVAADGGTHAAKEIDRTPDFSTIARGAPVPWTMAPGYRAELVATGFQLPVDITFVPHPGDSPDSPVLYVAELYGSVKVLTRSGSVRDYARDLLNFDPRAPIPGHGERGIGGITIDPANGDVLVTAIQQLDPNSPWTAPRILRLPSEDGGLSAARVIPLIEFNNEQMAPSHQISTLTFGPDDKLYVHVGSGFSWIAQEMYTIDGKILRMNRDGSAPPDNPFYDANDGITATDYIYALGFRNPFGGAWRIADQSLYEVENGPSTDRLALVTRARNYGWDGSDITMLNHAIYNWYPPVAPIQIAFTEPERFGGSGFPLDKMRSAFVTESGATWASGPQTFGKRISEFVLDLNGGPLLAPPTTLARYTGSGKATAAGLAAGPDGLYFTDLYRDFGYQSPFDAGANLFRIRYVGVANFDVSFRRANTVVLTDRSSVPDTQSVAWDFGDGTTSEERNPQHAYAESGKYVIRQTVTGARGEVTYARRIFAGDNTSDIDAEYYETEGDPQPTLKRPEQLMQFDWSASPVIASPAFAAKFTVDVTPRFSETYRFTVRTQDRVRMYVDDRPLVEAWEPDGSGNAEGSVDLVAGHSYKLTVEFAVASSAPSLDVWWQSESQPRMLVPRSTVVPKRRAVTPP